MGSSDELRIEAVELGGRVALARFETGERGALVGESTLGLAGAATVLGRGVASAVQANREAANRTTVNNRVGRMFSLRYRD